MPYIYDTLSVEILARVAESEPALKFGAYTAPVNACPEISAFFRIMFSAALSCPYVAASHES